MYRWRIGIENRMMYPYVKIRKVKKLCLGVFDFEIKTTGKEYDKKSNKHLPNWYIITKTVCLGELNFKIAQEGFIHPTCNRLQSFFVFLAEPIISKISS